LIRVIRVLKSLLSSQLKHKTMKHLKTTLLAFALLFSVNALMAQEKYEYATLMLHTSGTQMFLSVNGDDYQEITFDKTERKGPHDTNPALKQISKMNADGWELFDTTSVPNVVATVFLLRRKKQ